MPPLTSSFQGDIIETILVIFTLLLYLEDRPLPLAPMNALQEATWTISFASCHIQSSTARISLPDPRTFPREVGPRLKPIYQRTALSWIYRSFVTNFRCIEHPALDIKSNISITPLLETHYTRGPGNGLRLTIKLTSGELWRFGSFFYVIHFGFQARCMKGSCSARKRKEARNDSRAMLIEPASPYIYQFFGPK